MEIDTGLLKLNKRKRPLVPVAELNRHVETLSEQNVENGGEGPLAFLLDLMVHDPGVDDPGDLLKELEMRVELVEVVDEGGDTEAGKGCWCFSENLSQFVVELAPFAELHDVDDEDLIGGSDGEQGWTEDVDLVVVVEHIRIHGHRDAN